MEVEPVIVKRKRYTLDERREHVLNYIRSVKVQSLRDYCIGQPFHYSSLSNWIRSYRRGEYIALPSNNLAGYRKSSEILKVVFMQLLLIMHMILQMFDKYT